MRRAVLLLSVFATAVIAAPTANAAERPLPEIPPVYCDPGPCFPWLEDLPPSERSATRPPDPHCDPMACPDPVGGAQDCANAVVQYVVTLGQPQGCDPVYGG